MMEYFFLLIKRQVDGDEGGSLLGAGADYVE